MADGGALRARIPDALLRLGLRAPRGTLIFWALVCAAALPGISQLRIDTSTDSVLDRGHPAWQIYQQSQAQFGGDEIIVVAFEGAHPYEAATVEAVIELGQRASEFEEIRRIDSIDTVPVIRATENGDLDLRTALESAPLDPSARSRHLEALLDRDRIAPRNLVSEDRRVLAVNLVLERGAEARHARLLSDLDAIVEPLGGVLSGVPVFRVAANERTQEEILAFAPITALLIAAFLLAIFRAPLVVLIGVAPGVVGSWLLVAAMGYLGAPLSITTMVLPSIILALGCAYAMHLLSAASEALRGDDAVVSGAELERVLRRVALPVALSGLTTVIGFVAITAVRIEAVQFTGGYGALGVLVVTAVSLTLVPATLMLRPLPTPAPRGFSFVRHRAADWLVTRLERHGTLVLASWMILSIAVGVGITRIEVETDATRWLPPGHPVRDNYESIRESLSGISPMNVLIHAPDGGGVLEPETLAAIAGLGEHLETLDEVGKTLSIADPLRQLHGAFESDASQPLPESRAQAEQYLLLLESVEQITDLISSDWAQANLLIRANDNGSARLAEVAEKVTAWWAENGPPDHSVTTTGIMYEFARAEDEIAYGQLRGLGVALAVISCVLFAIFRWPRLAFVTLVPNAIPLALIFGSLGLFGIPLDAGTVLIGVLALGVAVDDTIHLATGFYAAIRAGEYPLAALRTTFVAVLPPIAATSAMIATSFFVLGFSEFTITRNLGLLTGSIMLLCLLADVTLLPALLLRLPFTGTGDRPSELSAPGPQADPEAAG